MKQTALNLLGYSSFSILALTGQVVQAQGVEPSDAIWGSPRYVGDLESSTRINTDPSIEQSGCGCQEGLPDASSDAIGALAIDQLGCDCAGCRNTMVRMAQSETLRSNP